MSKPISKVARVGVPGPLEEFSSGFESALLTAGYTPLSAVVQLRLMAHLSRWLDQHGFVVGDLSGRAEQYLADRRAAGYQGLRSPRALTPLMGYLAQRGALGAEPPPALLTPAEALLASFERYLVVERGLARSTVSAYVMRAGRFLARYVPNGDVASVGSAEVTAAVLAECSAASVGAGQYFVAALRAFLRYCYVEGFLARDVSAAAMTVTGRRFSALPKGIGVEDTAALLASFDRDTAVGCRDYALVLMLLRLGLRAGEVASLSLDDIDWRAGEVEVNGKGRRHERLPLPADVGAALADYLQRGRPTTLGRQLFCTVMAPVRGLTREAVSNIVRRACVRASIRPCGAHRLRHTMACEMIRAQVAPAEIGQVLRHRSPTSTAIYARVDMTALGVLAGPWPVPMTTVGQGRR